MQTYQYDANGNLTSGGGRTLTWDSENRISSVTANGLTESYTYDADGERVTKTRGGVTTIYLEGVWEEALGGATTSYYLFNGQAVALRDSVTNQVSYLVSDQLGSVSLLLTASASGAPIVSQQFFMPWGQVRGSGISQTSLNYTGQRLDGTGLLYYHARYYDPALARFVSADSVVPGSASGSLDGVALKPLTVDFHEPGFAATLRDENRQQFWFRMDADDQKDATAPRGPAKPQSLNRYSYVQNNPVRWTDPTGRWTFSIGLNASIGLFGGGTVGIGMVWDSHSNIGVYRTTGAGQVLGGGFGVGLSASVTNADTILDTSGPGLAMGFDAPARVGSGDVVVGLGTKNEVTTTGVSLGTGLGPMADLHVYVTDTKVRPIFGCSFLPCRLPPVKPVPAPGPLPSTSVRPRSVPQGSTMSPKRRIT